MSQQDLHQRIAHLEERIRHLELLFGTEVLPPKTTQSAAADPATLHPESPSAVTVPVTSPDGNATNLAEIPAEDASGPPQDPQPVAAPNHPSEHITFFSRGPIQITYRDPALQTTYNSVEEEVSTPSPLDATAPALIPNAPPAKAPARPAAASINPASAHKAASPSPHTNQPPAKTEAPKTAAPTIDLERAIGGRIFAAAGAIIVVIGVGLFLQMAYKMGWMDLLSPTRKCLLGAAFGAALLAAGEVIRRRLSPAASAGISAAGLGTLYASAWATLGLYQLVPSGAAFIMLAAVAAIGFVVASRARSAPLAILSLIGGYINPLIIGGDGPALVMPTYLLALLCAGLALSAWRAKPFRPLRGLVWWGTLIFGTLWITVTGLDVPSITLVFIALVWAAMHVELSLSARSPSPSPSPSTSTNSSPDLLDATSPIKAADLSNETTTRLATNTATETANLSAAATLPPPTYLGAPHKSPSRPIELSWKSSRFIATSFTTTIWTVAIAAHVLRHGTQLSDWLAPAFAAAVTTVVASMLVGHLRLLRDWPRTDAERLGAGLAVQGGSLLIVAVALALSGSAQVVAWLALGAAAVTAGRWIRSKGLDSYGIIALSLGTVRLILIDAPYAATPLWSYNLEGLILSTWMLLMVLSAAAWATISLVILHGSRDEATEEFAPRPPVSQNWQSFALIAQVLAGSLLAWSVVDPAADLGSIALFWLALACGTLAIGRRFAIPALAAHGIIVLSIASFSMFFWLANNGPGWTLTEGGGLIFSRWTMLMIAVAAAWGACSAMLFSDTAQDSASNQPARRDIARHDDTPRPLDPLNPWRALAHFAAVAVPSLLALSILHERADAGSVALIWVGLAIAALACGRLLSISALAVQGLTVLSISGIIMITWYSNQGPGWTFVSSSGLIFSRWTLLMLTFSAATALAAAISPRWRQPVGDGTTQHTITLPQCLAASAIIAMLAAFWHQEVAPEALALLWLALSIPIFALHRFLPRFGLDLLAYGAIAAATFAGAVAWQPEWVSTPGLPLLHGGFLSSLLALAVTIAATIWLRKAPRFASPGPTLSDFFPVVLAAAGLLLFASTSYEVARSATVVSGDNTARNAAVSIWWGLFATALLILGFNRRIATIRHAGLLLLAVATLKAVIIDMAAVPQIWRIASFIALGLLMLGVAAVYLRVSARFAPAPTHPAPPKPNTI